MGAPRRTTITRQRKAVCDKLCKVEFGIKADKYEYIQELGEEDLVLATTEFEQSIVVCFDGNEANTYADDITYFVEEA